MWKIKFCGQLEKLPTKITLKFHLEPNFYNFQEKKDEKVLS